MTHSHIKTQPKQRPPLPQTRPPLPHPAAAALLGHRARRESSQGGDWGAVGTQWAHVA